MFLTPGPASAHHAFTAEVRRDKPSLLVGTITKMEWINPHAWLSIDVPGARWKGRALGSRIRIAERPLQTGLEKNLAAGRRAGHSQGLSFKDGRTRGNAADVTLPDGTKLFAGSSGNGAPSDGPPQ